MAFKFYCIKQDKSEIMEKGQEWHGESIEENLALCDFEGCRDVFERYFTRDSSVLEAGCGLGRWVLDFKRRGYNIIGCDIDHQALKDARDYDSSVCMIETDVRQLPFKDEYFDAIISLGVIEHFENGPAMIIEEKSRILKPNGVLLVAVPYNSLFRRIFVNHVISLKKVLLQILGRRFVFSEYRYSKKELINFLDRAGFKIESCYPELLDPPRHVGAYIDYIHITGLVPENKFQTPGVVSMIANLIKSVFPWSISGMVLCVARKKI